MDHSFSTIRRASRSRARGVRAALAWVAWDAKTSWWERFLDSSTPHREVFTHLRRQIVSSHVPDQRAWSSQLGGGEVDDGGGEVGFDAGGVGVAGGVVDDGRR